MKRRILITGAGGFVGGALASGFAELGWSVVGLDRNFAGARKAPGIDRVTVDVAEGVPSAVPEVDVVVHAAWVTTHPRVLGITPADYLTLNLRPLLAVLEYAARRRPSDFVFLSSSGVFAPNDATEGLTDRDVPTGTAPYAASKRAGEILASAAFGEGPRTHVARLGYLYGRSETASSSRAGVSQVSRWLAAARLGQELVVRSDDPRREWTFVEDLAPAFAALIDGPLADRVIHVGTPQVSRDSGVAALVASHFPGTRTAIEPVATALKPPMVPSALPALANFAWTDLRSGVEALVAEEAMA